jgi:tetratricopeptide (TPR) repeat protein
MPLAFVTWLRLLKWLLAIAVLAWVLWRWLQKSRDEPGQLVRKWTATALLVLALLFVMVVPFLAAAIGIVIAIIWAPNLAEFLARPLTSAIDGGNQEPEAQPSYSIALARRKQGRYSEALEAVQEELEKFPNDFNGLMLLAEIQIEDLHNFPAGQATVEQIAAHPAAHKPANVAYALNCLSDWFLYRAADRQSARRCLERIRELFPDTELAQIAAQHIAHLPSEEVLAERREPRRFPLAKQEEYLGLREHHPPRSSQSEDPGLTVAQCLEHLKEHPLDNEVREKLAVAYADHYGRLDLATEHLERLIRHPQQQPKQVVHWLNLLADLQITHRDDVAGARQTLQRIIDLYPHTAAAEAARHRMAFLNLEARRRLDIPHLRLEPPKEDRHPED